MKSKLFQFWVLIFILTSCTPSKEDSKKHVLDKIEVMNSRNDYLDTILFDLRDQGYFLSTRVSNNGNIKDLTVHNGVFFRVYSNNYQFDNSAYRLKIKPMIAKKEVIQLTDDQWLKLSDYFLDTNDYFSEQEFQITVLKYFDKNIQKEKIPQQIILKIAHFTFLKHGFFYQDDYTGNFQFIQ